VFDQLSRSELLQLMELANRCLTATTPEQLESIISSIYALASFRKAALCVLSNSDSEVKLAHFVNHSYGSDWADVYSRQNFHRVDPILNHAATTDGVFRWDEALPVAGDESASFLEAAESHGIAGGVSFSCAGIAATSPFRSVLSIAGVPNDEVERTLRILTTIGPHLHESYRRVLATHASGTNPLALVAPEPALVAAPPGGLAAPDAGSGIKLATQQPVELSAREREVLCWAQQGKTYWEIGSILGITERTVKFHVARIKSKLDVVSTAHAIAKAMRSGLIT
jgi:LuxR family transcriptional regulator, quorum-sensing system regulator CviR